MRAIWAAPRTAQSYENAACQRPPGQCAPAECHRLSDADADADATQESANNTLQPVHTGAHTTATEHTTTRKGVGMAGVFLPC